MAFRSLPGVHTRERSESQPRPFVIVGGHQPTAQAV
jgi:hypothetical protein